MFLRFMAMVDVDIKVVDTLDVNAVVNIDDVNIAGQAVEGHDREIYLGKMVPCQVEIRWSLLVRQSTEI